MTAITTRSFVPADLIGILEIQGAAGEMAQWRAEDYEHLAEDPSGLILVAEWKGASAIAGFAAARAIGTEAELQNLAVRPDFRRRGVGRELVTAIHERLAHAGVQRVFLEARISNLAALNLYRACGYTQCGLRRQYYVSDGEDALVFEHQLSA